jgi:hypothetical protein
MGRSGFGQHLTAVQGALGGPRQVV